MNHSLPNQTRIQIVSVMITNVFGKLPAGPYRYPAHIENQVCALFDALYHIAIVVDPVPRTYDVIVADAADAVIDSWKVELRREHVARYADDTCKRFGTLHANVHVDMREVRS